MTLDQFCTEAVLLVGGAMASGKSYIADRIAVHFENAARASFGATLRRMFDELESSNESPFSHIQDFGEYTVRHNWHKLWMRVLAEAEPPGREIVIVDGIRHVFLYKKLLNIYCDRLGLLMLDPPKEVILARRSRRTWDSRRDLHAVERETRDLFNFADVLLRGNAAVSLHPAALAAMFDWITEK